MVPGGTSPLDELRRTEPARQPPPHALPPPQSPQSPASLTGSRLLDWSTEAGPGGFSAPAAMRDFLQQTARPRGEGDGEYGLF